MPIVWTHADGHEEYMVLLGAKAKVREVEPAPGESKEQAVLRLAEVERAKVPHLAGATPSLMRTAEWAARRAARNASASAQARRHSQANQSSR